MNKPTTIVKHMLRKTKPTASYRAAALLVRPLLLAVVAVMMSRMPSLSGAFRIRFGRSRAASIFDWPMNAHCELGQHVVGAPPRTPSTTTSTCGVTVTCRGFHSPSRVIRTSFRAKESSLDDFVAETIQDDGEEATNASVFKRGQGISVTVTQFGPMGASVSINDGAGYGLILQKEIAMFRAKRDGEDVMIGEELPGFVERVRDDGKIDVSLRSIGLSRIAEIKQTILDALEGSPLGYIPVGDKSTPEDIGAYFHGLSKADFKKAIGTLYKEGFVRPGQFETAYIPEEERDTQKIEELKLESSKKSLVHRLNARKNSQSSAGEDERGGEMNSIDDRNNLNTVFVGNLPASITEKALKKKAGALLGSDSVLAVRIALDEAQKPKGFGYIDLKDEGVVSRALIELKGLEISGRRLRVDRALRANPTIENVSVAALKTTSVDQPSLARIRDPSKVSAASFINPSHQMAAGSSSSSSVRSTVGLTRPTNANRAVQEDKAPKKGGSAIDDLGALEDLLDDDYSGISLLRFTSHHRH
jgi:CvfB-like winged helix domain/RNA recognition motif. (a.k.a. RRM, RBD, or RNP domain)